MSRIDRAVSYIRLTRGYRFSELHFTPSRLVAAEQCSHTEVGHHPKPKGLTVPTTMFVEAW